MAEHRQAIEEIVIVERFLLNLVFYFGKQRLRVPALQCEIIKCAGLLLSLCGLNLGRVSRMTLLIIIMEILCRLVCYNLVLINVHWNR